MPRWVINVLFVQCVGVRGTTVGVIASVGVAIQVTVGPSGRSNGTL